MNIKKIEKQFTKVIKKEYGHGDGKPYVSIDKVEYIPDGELITFNVRYGKELADGKCIQQKCELTYIKCRLYHNVKVLIGMLLQAIADNEADGNCLK